MENQEQLVFYFNYDREIPEYADRFQSVIDAIVDIQAQEPSRSDNQDEVLELDPVEEAIDKVEAEIPEDQLLELPADERREYRPIVKYSAVLHVLHDLLEMDYRVEIDRDCAFDGVDLEPIHRFDSKTKRQNKSSKPPLYDNYIDITEKVEAANDENQRYILLVAPLYNLNSQEDDVSSTEFKNRERKILQREQKDQFRESSVKEFIREMEDPQGRGGDSITHLITDGSDLHADLAPLAELERENISSELEDTIQPYLQPIPKTNNEDSVDESQSALTRFNSNEDSGDHSGDDSATHDRTERRGDIVNPTETHDEHTGLRLQDIWRYFRYSWLTPYNTAVGRNINFLIRDAARPNDPVMGIASLGSSMMNFGTRDDHIGWTEHGLRARRTRKHRVNLIERQLPKEERTPEKKTETVPQIEWLETKEEHQIRRQQISEETRQAVQDVIEDAINDVRFDDFVDQYNTVLAEFKDLEYQHFKHPTSSDYENTQAALRRLEGLARYVIASNTDKGTERKDTDLTSFHSRAEERDQDTNTNSNSNNSSTAVDRDDNGELTTTEKIVNKYGLDDIDLDDISIEDNNPEKMSSWRDRSETALFVKKRAEALQSLLQARYHLLKFDREHQDASAEDFINAALDRKSHPGLNRALRTALREIKKRRSGACMMNIMVCGAIPPYNEILGGKLAAMALTGPKTIASYKEIYGDQVSEIASGMKGEEVQKPTELVFLDTTGLFEKGSAQYDRIRIPTDNGEIRYEEIGTTDGVGTIQFGATTRKWLSNVTRVDEGRRVVRGRFGEGVSPRLRKIRQGLTKCGLSSDLLKHNSRRVIYSVDLAENAKPFLRAESEEPQYYWNFDDIDSEQQSIYNFWKNRWVSKRVQKEWVLDSIRDFDRDEFLLSNHFEDQNNETFSRYQE